jgi:hypothetical protein
MTLSVDPGDDLLRLEPWLGAFRRGLAAAAYEHRPPGDEPGPPWLDLALLSAVCLRETWAGWAPGYFPPGRAVGWGDRGRGFGLFQADRGTWAREIRSGALSHPETQARLAAEQLLQNHALLRATFRDTTLPGGERGALLLRGALAGYNAWVGSAALQMEAGLDVDGVTTGKDYSRDVLRRAELLRRRAPGSFT